MFPHSSVTAAPFLPVGREKPLKNRAEGGSRDPGEPHPNLRDASAFRQNLLVLVNLGIKRFEFLVPRRRRRDQDTLRYGSLLERADPPGLAVANQRLHLGGKLGQRLDNPHLKITVAQQNFGWHGFPSPFRTARGRFR